MADGSTSNYSLILPEVDGAEGTWGTSINTNLTNLDSLLSGGTPLTAIVVDSIKIDGTNIGLTSDTDIITLAPNSVTVAGTLTATALSGPLTGNVTGNLTGNITGNTTVSGTVTADALTMGDNEKISLGDDADLEIYHDGSNSIIASSNSSVAIKHDNATKLETASDGITVTGNITLDGTVDGVDIDALNTTVSGKANIASPTFTGTVSGITSAMVGLGNVENKSSATIRSEIQDSDIPATIARDSELTSFITASSSDVLTNKSIDAGQLTGTIDNARLSDTIEITSTDTGSGEAPQLSLFRDSSSPAASDNLGTIKFFGEDSVGNKTEYASMHAEIADPNSGSEDGRIRFALASAGGLENPTFTILNNGLFVHANNDIFMEQNSNIRFEGTTAGNGFHTTFFVDDPTADRSVNLPDASGTVALIDATNTAEFFEIASSTAQTSDNACHPVLAIYDNSDRSGQSENPSGGLNNAGALRFYFNNKAGHKTFAAGMRAIAVDIKDGEERAGIEFCLPTDDGSETVTDVTASHLNIESPVMALFKYGLVMAAGNDIFLNDVDDVIEWAGGNKQRLRGRASDNGQLSTITLPDVTSGTLIANSSGVISESVTLMELSSTDAGATEKPVISLYRDSASPADADDMGSVRFFGNNANDEKVFYAGMYCGAPKVNASGQQKGSLRFHVADGNGADVGITDPTAEISGEDDPVMIITSTNIECKGANLFVHDGRNIVLEGSGSNNLTLDLHQPTADRTLIFPNDDGTIAHIADNGGLQHPTLSSAPSSPSNGQTYYNTTTHKLQLYANDAWVDLN